MENDLSSSQAPGNANNPIRNNDVSSESMVSLISGLSDSVLISYSPCQTMIMIDTIGDIAFNANISL